MAYPECNIVLTCCKVLLYLTLSVTNFYVVPDSDSGTWYIIPYPTAFPYGNGMLLHFYQQQESSTTKTVHKVINKRLKTYV